MFRLPRAHLPDYVHEIEAFQARWDQESLQFDVAGAAVAGRSLTTAPCKPRDRRGGYD